MYILRSIIFIAMVCASIAASAASFDCSKAGSVQERLICEDKELTGLDETLNSAYKEYLSKSKDRDSAKESQMEWLSGVRDKCASKECLRAAYGKRLSAIKSADSASAARKDACPITESDLVGSWVLRSGEGFFEEMAFSFEGKNRRFDSWLHHRPEFSGAAWSFKDCTIYIKHPYEDALNTALVVVGYHNRQLHVKEEGENAEAVYRKTGK